MFGFGFIWWLLRWSFATVFFIAIMVAAGYFVFNEAVAGGEYVTVPDIIGRPLQEADDMILREGLRMGTTNYAQTENYPENYVIHQNPAPGKVVRARRYVYTTVSRQEKASTPVPNLIGKNVETAIKMLEEAQLRPGTTIARTPSTARADTVIGQDPPAGAKVARSAEVQLLVSEGRGRKAVTVYMPDLIGLTPEQAEQELKPLNVDGRLMWVKGDSPPFDEVLEQRPESGMLLKPGDLVIYKARMDPGEEIDLPPPDAWREVTVEYEIPPFGTEREVRIDVIYKDGTRRTPFPPLEYYREGLPPKYLPETKIRQPIPFQDEVTVEVFLDDEKVRSYHYVGDADPIIRDFAEASGEPSSAGT